MQHHPPQDSESYVHRSGRTGRAGRSGTAILLHSERERRSVGDLERRTGIRSAKQGPLPGPFLDLSWNLPVGIRFAKQGPPSVQTVMGAAAALVPRRIGTVDPRLLPYFEEAAAALLEGDDALQKVAAMCAVVAGQSSLSQHSLLTGEEHLKTLLVEATDGAPLEARRLQICRTPPHSALRPPHALPPLPPKLSRWGRAEDTGTTARVLRRRTGTVAAPPPDAGPRRGRLGRAARPLPQRRAVRR